MNQPNPDKTDDIDLSVDLSSDQAPRNPLARIAVDDELTHSDPQPVAAVVPPNDDAEIISDMVIRERLIEWLVGFLPGFLQGNQGSL